MARRNIVFLSVLLSILVVGSARAAPVTWTFYGTSCTVVTIGFCGPYPPGSPGPIQTPPIPVAVLGLPGPDSTGSAGHDVGLPPAPPPVFTGDGNNFSLFFIPAENPSALILNPPTELDLDAYYMINWTETGGVLTSIDIAYYKEEGLSGDADLGLYGGQIGSDGDVGDCNMGECRITGYWSSNAVPEPSSLISMLAALIMLVGSIWRPWRIQIRR